MTEQNCSIYKDQKYSVSEEARKEYEKLFHKIKRIGEDVKNLAVIVQNPVEIPTDQQLEWKARMLETISELNQVSVDVLKILDV